MADQVQNGAPFPHSNGSSVPQNLQQQTNPTSAKRNNPRHRKQQSHSNPQFDGTVSDSVTHPAMSPRSKKAPKPRQQSVAMGALPNENGYVSHANSAKTTRPVSVGGNMLPATPAKEQAYAGPTFQASPAPSSLPVPKFFSRSVPNVAAQQKSLESRMAGEKTPETEQSSPEPELVAPARDTQTSPLDMFFKADKAEKERSASLQSPEMRTRRAVPATEPRNTFQQSGKHAFLQELNGDSGMPNPRTVPHPNRPSPQRMSSSDTEGMFAYSDTEREAATKSLKDLLFKVDATPPPPRANSNPRNTLSPFETPSPFQRSASGPSTPTPPADHYSLHYGNRANLSPLFKATRSDTPPSRPSGLRQQELASDATSPTHSKQQNPPQMDPDSFSRNYLNQHIRASQPAAFPPVPLPNGTTTTSNSSSTASHNQPASTAIPTSQHGVGVQGTGASPRTAGSGGEAGQDIRTMEDDLRRMLKINVLSN